MSNLDKKLEEWFKKNVKIDEKIDEMLEKLATELMDLIKSKTGSKTIKNAIYLKRTGKTFTISFDDNAFVRSAFTKDPFNYSDYSPDAYKPLMYNEGWEVQHPVWRNYFGSGAKSEGEHFIEKAVEEFLKRHKSGSLSDIKVKITVSKNGDFRYDWGRNSSIHEYAVYGDDILM